MLFGALASPGRPTPPPTRIRNTFLRQKVKFMKGAGHLRPILGPPPLPPDKVTIVGTTKMYRWENLVGPLLVHNPWVPSPLPPPLSECIVGSCSPRATP